MKKVLWVKFGWSEYYRGEPVNGNFGWLKDAKGGKNEGKGHEAFNFMPVGDTYYCYVPPQAKNFAPWNVDNRGWTVICLAKHPKYTGVHVVGWYENATLIGDWLPAPPDLVARRGGAAHPAYDWSYCITSQTAYFVPPKFRTLPFSDASVRQGKYSFLAGPGVKSDADKLRVLSLLEGRMSELVKVAVKNPSEATLPDPEVDAADPLIGFGTPEHRKKVEKAAEAAVIAHYHAQGFGCEDCTKINCGYDFLFTKGSQSFHVEVKGTASDIPAFFLTRNEHDVGYVDDPAWRLAMVTNALTDTPEVVVFDAKRLKKTFALMPMIYAGKQIPVAGNS